MKKIIEIAVESSTDSRPAFSNAPVWETLEPFARKGIQQWMQRLLEEEIDDLLGRRKSERRSDERDPTGRGGYRNGFGKPRTLALTSGTITIKRPRVRGLEARFASRLRPLFPKSTDQVGALLPELCLHGLSLGDFDLVLRGLLGDGAPHSPSHHATESGVGKPNMTPGSGGISPGSTSSTCGRMGSM